MCFFLIFFLKITKIFGQEKSNEIDIKKITPSDYSVMISNLPVANYDEKELIEVLKSSWQKRLKKIRTRSKKVLHDEDYKSDDEDIRNEDNNFGMEGIKIIYNMEFARKLVGRIWDLCEEIDKLYLRR